MKNTYTNCQECGKKLYQPNKTGYCYKHSRPQKGWTNSGQFKKGHQPAKPFIKGEPGYWKGKKRDEFSDEWKAKLSKSLLIGQKKGEENINWKGDEASYKAKHIWMITNYGNPPFCEDCGKKGYKHKGKWNILWSNIDHQYRRIREDYNGRCQKCHIKYDKEHKI